MEEFNPYIPISTLPNKINRYYASEANILRMDMEENRLEVELIEPDYKMHPGQKIRSAVNESPDWYKRFYHEYNMERKWTENALERIAEKEDKPYDPQLHNYIYDTRLRDFIHTRLAEGYKGERGIMLPNEEVVTYFGIDAEQTFDPTTDYDYVTNGKERVEAPF